VPRVGIKAQITLLGLGLLSIPYFGWLYWQEIQATALDAQGRIQLIETKAIATSLVATQENIAELLAATNDSELERHAISAPVVSTPIHLDGRFHDWKGQRSTLHDAHSGYPISVTETGETDLTSFGFALAQTANHLYVAVNVHDDIIKERLPNHLRLDYNDHVQLTYRDTLGALRRIILPAQGQGELASFYTNHAWTHGVDIQHPVSNETIPSHKTDIQGFWRYTDTGYALELRISKRSLDEQRPAIHLSVVDIDDHPQAKPSAVLASLPSQHEEELNPIGFHAQELQRVIDQLKTTYARLWVFDRRGREWAYAGREADNDIAPLSFNTKCVQDALSGSSQALQYVDTPAGNLERIIACYPIIDAGNTLGVVVIDESASHVLAQEEDKIRDIAMRLGSVVAVLLFVLFGYGFFLVRRITKLNKESQRSIDAHGRIESTTIDASKTAPDELGDLSRTMSSLLEKQQAYTHFLERIPQTLRHEISNPLNKLRTSLELLLEDQPELANDKYIKRIDAGTDQITNITTQLTEAASLESAIQEESLSELDLNKFLHRYLIGWEPEVHIQAFNETPYIINGDTNRLEQLLDKLLDNACSFCRQDGRVTVRVEQHNRALTVAIENDGPLLSIDNPSHLFAPMVSTRSSGSTIHLGLGLHIAKLIADKHGASLEARNRPDKTGVIFEVHFRHV